MDQSTFPTEPSLLDLTQAMFKTEWQKLEPILIQRMHAEFVELREKTGQEVTDVIRSMVREEIANSTGVESRKVFAGEQRPENKGRGVRREGTKDGDAMNTQKLEEETTLLISEDIAIVNTKLDTLTTRLARLEKHVDSILQRDQELRTELNERLKTIEDVMNAILQGTPQGKQFIAENYVLDPIRYQDAIEAGRREFVSWVQGLANEPGIVGIPR